MAELAAEDGSESGDDDEGSEDESDSEEEGDAENAGLLQQFKKVTPAAKKSRAAHDALRSRRISVEEEQDVDDEDDEDADPSTRAKAVTLARQQKDKIEREKRKQKLNGASAGAKGGEHFHGCFAMTEYSTQIHECKCIRCMRSLLITKHHARLVMCVSVCVIPRSSFLKFDRVLC